MSIHIVYTPVVGPWGGGNQFLRALRRELEKQGLYSKTPEQADAILFNSHHNIRQVFAIKRAYPKKVFLHRVDGPLSYVRGGGIRNRLTDFFIFWLSAHVADVTIFQSHWSKEAAAAFGYYPKTHDVVIHNAADPNIFHPQGRRPWDTTRKIHIIMSSWSSNMRKGFGLYDYLDRHLDWSRFHCTFIGNSPIRFQHIRHIPPLNSPNLAEALRQADIFLTASESDPCSNALIEAMACGLPAVALADGGHPELVSSGGVLFHGTDDVLSAIDSLVSSYEKYQAGLSHFDIGLVAQVYGNAARSVTY